MSTALAARRMAWNLSKWRPLRLPLEGYRHRGLTRHDVFIACYPRSGSTWLRFMLCDILLDIEPDFDKVNRSITDVGRHARAPGLVAGGGRLVKTHERYLPKYTRAVYLVRDVRDVVLSEYRHQQMEGMFNGDFDTFFSRFMRGRANAFARWDDHVTGWLDAPIRDLGSFLLVRFEHMRLHPHACIQEVLDFLGLPADADRIRQAIERNDLGHMREKEQAAPQGPGTSFADNIRFVNQGRVQGWRDELTREQLQALHDQFGDAMKRAGYDPQE